jgi:hypothetical protein
LISSAVGFLRYSNLLKYKERRISWWIPLNFNLNCNSFQVFRPIISIFLPG